MADALRAAIANVEAVATASLREPTMVALADGQRIEISEPPVRRAGAYVPGGRAPYASTVVMCAVTATAAGVDELAVCAPPGAHGEAHPVILAACGLCGVEEVYRMGGAQAIAALAYGTDLIPAVDVIVGPGNAWVQEAKRQVVGQVSIDGVAGPSELVIAASAGADPELAALDLLAQAEHGPASLLALISDDDALLEDVERRVSVGGLREGDEGRAAPLALVRAPEEATAVRLADLIAPEHMQLVGRPPRPRPTPSARPAPSLSDATRRPRSATTSRGRPRAPDRRGGPPRERTVGGDLPPSDGAGHVPRGHGGRARTRGSGDRPRRGILRARRIDGAARRMTAALAPPGGGGHGMRGWLAAKGALDRGSR